MLSGVRWNVSRLRAHEGSYARQFRWLTVTAASLWLRLSRQVRSPIILNSVSRQRPLMHIYIKPRNTLLSTKRRSSPNQIIVWDVYYQFVRFWIFLWYMLSFQFYLWNCIVISCNALRISCALNPTYTLFQLIIPRSEVNVVAPAWR